MDFIYKKALLKLVKDKIELPLASLDYSRSLDELLVEVDGYIDEYIVMGMEVVEDSLRQLYYDGVVDATIKLNQAAEHYDVDYEPLVPDVPDKLKLLISIQQHNVEDYALVLRGRLRSSIESRVLFED